MSRKLTLLVLAIFSQETLSCSITLSGYLEALIPHFELRHVTILEDNVSHSTSKTDFAKRLFKSGLKIKWIDNVQEAFHYDADNPMVYCPGSNYGLNWIMSVIEKDHQIAVKNPIFIWHQDTIVNANVTDVRIDQRVYHIVEQSSELIEAYHINGQVVRNTLGHFQESNRTVTRYVPTEIGSQGFVGRRTNLFGYHIVAMTETDPDATYFLKDFESKATFYEANQTYDVTEFVYGPYYDYFLLLSDMFNFTFTLYKRKDSQWGGLDEATRLPTGMMSNLVDGSAELVMTSYSMTLLRSGFVDYLPVISSGKYSIAIRSQAIPVPSWTTFFNPFRIDLWIVLVIVSLFLAMWLHLANLDGTSKSWKVSDHLVKLCGWIWVTGAANVGRKPSEPMKRNTSSNRIVMFTCLLMGNVTWIAFRASLTSELSLQPVTYPFNSLEGLSQSDYKLLTSPYGSSQASTFINSKQDSVYRKILDNNMDNDSFTNANEVQIKTMVESDEPYAYFNIKTASDVLALSLYKCKMIVHVWESTTIQNVMSFSVSKNSSLKEILSKGVLALIEQGKIDAEFNRFSGNADNDCSPLTKQVHPLSVYKLASIFAFLVLTTLASLVICCCENLHYKLQSNKIMDQGVVMQNRMIELDQVKEAQDLVVKLGNILDLQFKAKKEILTHQMALENLSIFLRKNS